LTTVKKEQGCQKGSQLGAEVLCGFLVFKSATYLCKEGVDHILISSLQGK